MSDCLDVTVMCCHFPSMLCSCMGMSAVSSFILMSVYQIVLLTKYWTRFSVAAVCVSVGMFFICSRITHSGRLFQRSPSDYYFLGNSLLTSCLGSVHVCCCEVMSGRRTSSWYLCFCRCV